MKKVLGLVAALGLSTAAFAGSYKKDLVDTASAAGDFDTLVTAIEAADLGSTLKGEGPFTVFAPSDAAFSALPEGKVEDLLKPENREMLVELLSYHVVPGKVLAEDITEGMESVENLAGSELNVEINEGVLINTASVTKTDIEASNGVIHVIDSVIMPSDWPSS